MADQRIGADLSDFARTHMERFLSGDLPPAHVAMGIRPDLWVRSVSRGHLLAVHEAGAPASGNINQTAARYSFPYCPNGGDGPLVLVVNAPHGGMRVRNVICYTSGYTPLCCN